MAYLSAFADELSPVFSQQLDFLKDNAIGFIELRFVNERNITVLNNKEINEVFLRLRDTNIGISAIGSPIGKLSVQDPFSEHFDLFKRVVDIADKLQTSNIRIFSFYPGAYVSEESFFDQVISRLSKMVEYVQGSDIILMHENEKGIFGHNAENCALLARTMHSKNFRLAYDPGNFVWGEHICNNMDVCWSKMKSWVDHIHIKDWKMNHYDTGCLPGSGDAQIPELIEKLVETKYKGFVTMEPHMDEGGQFGGHTSMDHYRQAITSFRRLAIQKGLNLK